MFVHIVCWKYKPETTEEEKDYHVKMLKRLPAIIPDILSFHVGRDELRIERSFDTGLVAMYPNRKAYDFYTAHPEHQKVAAFGKKISEKTVSVDFSVE
ncbi:MAG: Dabb family protein [Pyrinomonadaceae bacterium]|nr:Dabb family protein [Pyrinomonadaceae bacterium]MCX7639145.1 Dabb family protein [Pyrinomonadaceae bacterium]MDW8303634.1 Dabb family protein [Acidobacteriota bacterium]